MSTDKLTQEEIILAFVEQDLHWSDMKTLEDKEAVLVVSRKVGMEGLPTAQNMTEKDFDRLTKSMNEMADAILESKATEESISEAASAVMNQVDPNATVNNNNNVKATKVAEGEDTMNNTTNTNGATVNEENVGTKAESKMSQVKDDLLAKMKYAINSVPALGRKAEELSKMSSTELENYLRDKGLDLVEFIKEKLVEQKDRLTRLQDRIPNAKEEIEETKNILITVKDILDEDEINGWGKFKLIVVEIAKWIARIFIKAAQIIFKVALIITVGVIRIGALFVYAGLKAGVAVTKDVKAVVAKTKAQKAYEVYDETGDEADYEEYENAFEDYAKTVKDAANN